MKVLLIDKKGFENKVDVGPKPLKKINYLTRTNSSGSIQFELDGYDKKRKIFIFRERSNLIKISK